MTVYRMRHWSARNARWLNVLYEAFEALLVALHPLFTRIGYKRLDHSFTAVEKVTKGFLFDSHSCGQCTLGSTGMVCPMNCPKTLRNGPCGGVRADGGCEVQPDMTCVWVTAWEGSRRLREGEQAIQVIQKPVDVRLKDSSAWLRAARNKRDAIRG
ncbi:MAG: methylenetetrahydrofolate reductase C-terminal domain-containing protein [Pseudomonadales bacterium]